MIDTWDACLSRLQRDRSLLEPKQLRQRMEVLDHLESHPAWGAAQGGDADPAWPAGVVGRLGNLCAALEAANHRVYTQIREAIQRGRGPRSLLQWAEAVRPTGDTKRPS